MLQILFPYFYPRSPCGERQTDFRALEGAKIFLSTLSLRRATDNVPEGNQRRIISIHALLAESDAKNTSIAGRITSFLSTLSLRRATNVRPDTRQPYAISIHALLAESDRRGAANCYLDNIISIHALLAESDQLYINRTAKTVVFLSTLSLRRATMDASRAANCQQHFYPRSPCGERRRVCQGNKFRQSYFYPRSPCGERLTILIYVSSITYFYPRSPCGERPPLFGHCLSDARFLSTLSLRRAT